ncbi:hypothetical protein A2160_00400 [Candidatus Beckwithbacteria bacterium RBG_13_42_9]|uniref:Uncharacterized protein n=1 Tax=Candidatus Beckwithbacteria bacterium RBG_13_42_9 TaxID=1797457 RepID=A0A1F5E3Q2_9BACT|nr:MAG: hypothetical protein A2160_00400 [Candidatus Beckwithbacteria bacterium RBG_13_42_9]
MVGSVPGRKYSVFTGQPSQGKRPLRLQTATALRFGGGEKAWEGKGRSSSAITLCQIGEAPVIPEATAFMGVLSLLPTQTVTT